MNLNSYDNAVEKIDKHRTWVNIKYKQLISREIKYRKYISIGKRYDYTTRITTYYLILSDVPPLKLTYKHTVVDNYGRIKIKVNHIWNDTILKSIASDININISLIDKDEDGEVYELDI